MSAASTSAPGGRKAVWLCPAAEIDEFEGLLGSEARCADPHCSLERMAGHLLGLASGAITPLAAR